MNWKRFLPKFLRCAQREPRPPLKVWVPEHKVPSYKLRGYVSLNEQRQLDREKLFLMERRYR